MNIEDMSVEQLKAAWYDNFSIKERAERNMMAVNSELSKRTEPTPIAAVEEESSEEDVAV